MSPLSINNSESPQPERFFRLSGIKYHIGMKAKITNERKTEIYAMGMDKK